MKLCDLDEIKICVNRQYENCHGYSGNKKAIYREAILAVKSISFCKAHRRRSGAAWTVGENSRWRRAMYCLQAKNESFSVWICFL